MHDLHLHSDQSADLGCQEKELPVSEQPGNSELLFFKKSSLIPGLLVWLYFLPKLHLHSDQTADLSCQEKEPLDSEQPGSSELFYSYQSFTNSWFEVFHVWSTFAFWSVSWFELPRKGTISLMDFRNLFMYAILLSDYSNVYLIWKVIFLSPSCISGQQIHFGRYYSIITTLGKINF